MILIYVKSNIHRNKGLFLKNRNKYNNITNPRYSDRFCYQTFKKSTMILKMFNLKKLHLYIINLKYAHLTPILDI